jgi:tRNA pseudouridine38-40 synthase
VRYFFRVEYDGTRYGGWQRQKNAPSIEQTIEQAFTTATRAPCRVTGAGRTDAGVHARAQGAHVDVAADIVADSAIDCARCEASVNALLPPDIAVYHLQTVDGNFHARFSAKARRYRYYICTRKRPLLLGQAWMVFYDVDWPRIEGELAALIGTHDFSSFCASGSGAKHARCTVTHASLDSKDDPKIVTIQANRFVYTMVRSLVGTLIDIGRGHCTQPLAAILSVGDRRRAGQTAPAAGLVLDNVYYEGVD